MISYILYHLIFTLKLYQVFPIFFFPNEESRSEKLRTPEMAQLINGRARCNSGLAKTAQPPLSFYERDIALSSETSKSCEDPYVYLK